MENPTLKAYTPEHTNRQYGLLITQGDLAKDYHFLKFKKGSWQVEDLMNGTAWNGKSYQECLDIVREKANNYFKRKAA